MRFLVDESLPRAVALALAARGDDAIDVRDAGLRGATDDAIAERAAAESRVIVTADLDFSNVLRFPAGSHPGIVVARLPHSSTPTAIAARIVELIGEVDAALDGAITIVEHARVRILRTP